MTTTYLDAYGHLTWTVGNDDWVACFDAIRAGDKIRYHVVVNCDSAGFIDTVETGEVDANDSNAIDNIRGFPGYYADMCNEMCNQADYGPVEWEETEKAWNAHLDELLKMGTQPDPAADEAEEAAAAYEQSLEYFNRYIAGDR
jgi:hypothetical protein